MRRPSPALGSLLFAVVGPGLELGVGPAVLTGGWRGGADWPWAVRALGALAVAIGVLVVLSGFVRFTREGTGTPSPLAPPRTLVVSGAHRFLRHPMYVATAAGIAGEGLLAGRPVLLGAAGVYLAAMAVLARTVEEPLLARRHGGEWAAYAAAVPGWWPRRRAWRPSVRPPA